MPYRSEVLTKLNSFDELKHTEHTAAVAREARTEKIKKDMFNPASEQANLPLKAIQGEKQCPDWETTTPTNNARMYAHIAFWQHCRLTPSDWPRSGRLWMCQMASAGMLVRSKITRQACFALLTVDQTAVLAWKAVEIRQHKRLLFVPVTDVPPGTRPYVWLTIVNPDQWESYRIQWVGQCWNLLSCTAPGEAVASKPISAEAASAGRGARALCVDSPCKPISLNTASAYTAFKGMGHRALMYLADEYSVAVAATIELFDLVEILVRLFAPGLTELEYAEIMLQRM